MVNMLLCSMLTGTESAQTAIPSLYSLSSLTNLQPANIKEVVLMDAQT